MIFKKWIVLCSFLDMPRTLMSAESLVLGMFPVSSDQLGKGSATPSVPIHTRDMDYDYMVSNPL